MHAYIVRRLLYAVITFFGITVVTFALIHAVPGDPITFYIGTHGQNVSRPALEAIRHEYHLDDPLPKQYLYWLSGAVRLDFGRSTIDRRPVVERIGEKLPNTFELNFIAFLIAALIGLPTGLWSATALGPAPGALLGRLLLPPLFAASVLGGAAADAVLRGAA